MRGSWQVPLMSLHRRGGDDGGKLTQGPDAVQSSLGCYKTRRPQPAASILALVCFPPPPRAAQQHRCRKIIDCNPTDKPHKMADENTNPAAEETKVDETPISHPNAARRNSLEKQLAQRPDRSELVESKHTARHCYHRHRLS